MLSPVTVQNQNRRFSVIICKKRGHFSVMCIAQNIISLRSLGNCFAISSSATFELLLLEKLSTKKKFVNYTKIITYCNLPKGIIFHTSRHDFFLSLLNHATKHFYFSGECFWRCKKYFFGEMPNLSQKICVNFVISTTPCSS
jgi:hypothetical protein